MSAQKHAMQRESSSHKQTRAQLEEQNLNL